MAARARVIVVFAFVVLMVHLVFGDQTTDANVTGGNQSTPVEGTQGSDGGAQGGNETVSEVEGSRSEDQIDTASADSSPEDQAQVEAQPDQQGEPAEAKGEVQPSETDTLQPHTR